MLLGQIRIWTQEKQDFIEHEITELNFRNKTWRSIKEKVALEYGSLTTKYHQIQVYLTCE